MLVMNTTKKNAGFVCCGICFSLSVGLTNICFAHSGETLSSAWTEKIPTIDGTIASEEWSDAYTASFTLSYCGTENHEVTLYVKNDATYLYLAVVIKDDDYYASKDESANFYFDNNNDGLVYGAGDNKTKDDSLTIHTDGSFFDANTLYLNRDGTNDLLGAVRHTNPVPDGIGDYTFEYRHPLDSTDDKNDFSLSTGDTVGFTFSFLEHDPCSPMTGSPYWPSESFIPGGYGDIIIAADPSDTGSLNDTGITWSGNYPSGNNTDCSGDNVVAAQDCSRGRDVTHNDDSDGLAGFSYTKLDSNGEPLANQAAAYATTPWDCVQDNITGLIWEVKKDDGGLHDKDDRYAWYNTNPATNGGANGEEKATSDTCSGWISVNTATYCNTQAYVSRVNTGGLCGGNDWRMPMIKELESLANFGSINPAIDMSYFPHAVSSLVWSGSPFADYSDGAWYVNFYYGYSNAFNRSSNYAVRLVRGGQ